MTDKHASPPSPRQGRPGAATRSPLAVASAALAIFLAVLALLTARVSTGHDPALGASTASVVHVSRGGHATVRTTASGRVIGGSSGEGAGAGVASSSPAGALVTRSSGSQIAGEHDD
jgi:hypothetical protein